MNHFFTEAVNLRQHPIKRARDNTKEDYLTVLTYIVEKVIDDTDIKPDGFPQAAHSQGQTTPAREMLNLISVTHAFLQKKFTEEKSKTAHTKGLIKERMKTYRDRLFSSTVTLHLNQKNLQACIMRLSTPRKSKYLYMLICDLALILLEETKINHASKILREHLPSALADNIKVLLAILHTGCDIDKKFLFLSSHIKQYLANRNFLSKKEKRFIITANMSAGKSTLINALIGKPLARTSQEVCTGNVCYLYNKAYEDESIHLLTQNINLDACEIDLLEYDWDKPVSIASHFVGVNPNIPRLCLIDTPGVDASLYKEHSKMTHEALLKEDYDTVIYIVNPTRLGTDAENHHLQWIANNLPEKNIIFVLNKLDNYKTSSDSINESIACFREDLSALGFNNPVICPISAYFAYLIKLKITGKALSEDEEDEYALFSKKFMKESYDLSNYYPGVKILPGDSTEISLSKRAGLYGLEKILYEGKDET